MEKIFDIADWFLAKEGMTHKKLQKLCYYAQAWYCALYDGTPLFEDEIQAWIHGPVIKSLWNVYCDYKWNDIPKKESSPTFDEKVNNILDAVWDNYGELTGFELEALSCSEKPWQQTRGNLQPFESCIKPISIDAMTIYYRRKYEEDQNE